MSYPNGNPYGQESSNPYASNPYSDQSQGQGQQGQQYGQHAQQYGQPGTGSSRSDYDSHAYANGSDYGRQASNEYSGQNAYGQGQGQGQSGPGYSQQYGGPHGGQGGPSGGPSSGPSGGPPPAKSNRTEPQGEMVAFFAEVDSVKRDIVQYDDYIDRIEGLHKRSLAVTDPESQQASERQLDTLRNDARSLSESLKHQIKTLEAKSQRDSTKQAQAANIKRQFMQLIQKYQTTEVAMRQRYCDVAERQYRIVRPDATDAEVEQAIEDPMASQQIFSEALMSSNKQGQARQVLSEVQSRQREVQKISQTMEELAQLFQDMEVLVTEQDEHITQIDNHAATAQHDLEMGVGQQHKAVVSARKWRRKRVWCFVICLIIIIILALALGLGLGLHK